MGEALDENLLQSLYSWIDGIPLSRVKKDLRRDFSDGVLVAEIAKHYRPDLVELHNYNAANQIDRKLINWQVLNRKVFRKLGLDLAPDVINSIVTAKPWAVENFLLLLKRKIDATCGGGEDREVGMANSNKGVQEALAPSAEKGAKERGGARNVTHKGSRQSNSDKPEADQAMVSPHVNFGYSGTPGPVKTYKPSSTTKKAAAGDGQTVPRSMIYEKDKELIEKEETIQILNAKVNRLEHLLQLKDVRIDDLQTRFERLESERGEDRKPFTVHREAELQLEQLRSDRKISSKPKPAERRILERPRMINKTLIM